MSDHDNIDKTDAEWRDQLTPKQYEVLRRKGTEPSFSGEYYHVNDDGQYMCVGCGNVVFGSDAQYDSGSGWPSFFRPAADGAVELKTDQSDGMERVEVTCSRCGSHLGHVFEDGPADKTGQRYCINSVALKLEPKES